MRAAAEIYNEPPPTSKIKLEEISLHVQKVIPIATCHLAIVDVMKIAPVKYPIGHIEMCSF